MARPRNLRLVVLCRTPRNSPMTPPRPSRTPARTPPGPSSTYRETPSTPRDSRDSAGTTPHDIVGLSLATLSPRGGSGKLSGNLPERCFCAGGPQRSRNGKTSLFKALGDFENDYFFFLFSILGTPRTTFFLSGAHKLLQQRFVFFFWPHVCLVLLHCLGDFTHHFSPRVPPRTPKNPVFATCPRHTSWPRTPQ